MLCQTCIKLEVFYQGDHRVLRVLLSKLGPTVNKEAQLSIIRDSSQGITGGKGMVVVQCVDSTGLVLVLPVVTVFRVQATVVLEHFLILAKLVEEFTKDSVTCLL